MLNITFNFVYKSVALSHMLVAQRARLPNKYILYFLIFTGFSPSSASQLTYICHLFLVRHAMVCYFALLCICFTSARNTDFKINNNVNRLTSESKNEKCMSSASFGLISNGDYII